MFPYGIRRQAGVKGRQTGADRKAKNNMSQCTERRITMRVFITLID